MRVAIATVQVPFVSGGAEILADGLLAALRRAGCSVDLITAPFSFCPPSEVLRSLRWWRQQPFGEWNGLPVDRLIALKFPSWCALHEQKVAWVVHQHRDVYDLWAHAGRPRTLAERHARQRIRAADDQALRACRRVYAISRTTARRLQEFNRIPAEVLYHPPRSEPDFYTAPAQPYVFFPSRLETLKRQDLLVEAMRYVQSPVGAVFAGGGGLREPLAALVAQHGLGHRVRFLGPISDAEKLSFYAHSLAVFYGPYDEDYGYVTLEAMLASKPVITCTDSGGPLEFVVAGETGLVTAPEPQAVAEAIDALYDQGSRAAQMGRAGRARYESLHLSWDLVVDALLAT